MIRLHRQIKTILFWMIQLLTTSLIGQESIGLMHDNYLPTSGVRYNPSVIVDQKPWLDMQVAGAGGFLQSNYAYVPNTMLVRMPRSYPAHQFKLISTSSLMVGGYADAEIIGPGFTVGFNESAIGMHTRLRAIGYGKKMPEVLINAIREENIESVGDGDYIGHGAQYKSTAWMEIGVDYGKVLIRKNKNYLSWGVTVNKLVGVFHSSIELDRANVNVSSGKGRLRQLEGDYYVAKPAWMAGGGWSTSFGINYKKMNGDVTKYYSHSPISDCRIIEYKYKIGLSIIDFGYLNFDKNAMAGKIQTGKSPSQIRQLTLGMVDIETEQRSTVKSFTTGLPTAFVASFDYNLGNGFYTGSTIIQSVGFGKGASVRRANLLATSIRYEAKHFGITVPFMLQEYKNPMVGFALRIGALSIGTDNLYPFFVKRNQYQADIYFQLNFKINTRPICMPDDSKLKKLLCRGPKRKRPGKARCAKW